jgi:hypothetical protein
MRRRELVMRVLLLDISPRFTPIVPSSLGVCTIVSPSTRAENGDVNMERGSIEQEGNYRLYCPLFLLTLFILLKKELLLLKHQATKTYLYLPIHIHLFSSFLLLDKERVPFCFFLLFISSLTGLYYLFES